MDDPAESGEKKQRTGNDVDTDEISQVSERIYIMDMLYDEIELNRTWDIEHEYGVMSLSTTNKMGFPEKDLET